MAPVAPPRTASPVMVGRAKELDALATFGASLRPGEPTVAMVAGGAGMGKTRLIVEASRRWKAGGLEVLTGGCVPEGPPYHPLAAALRWVLPPSAPAIRLLAAQRGVARAEILQAMEDGIGAIADRTPAVLVVEDLHWSDRATREALTYLVTQAGAGCWGLVTTHRPEGPVPAQELVSVADVLQRRRTLRIGLEPLIPEQVADQIAAITGVNPSAQEAEALHRRSGGIPLLVEELIAAGDSRVPDHLRSLFQARITEQGADVVEALRVIAVAECCDELVITQALGSSVDAVAAALRRARQADLVAVDSDGYHFRHALLREAVYDDIPPGRRRELHGLVGTALSARPEIEPAALAAHWHQAGVPDRSARASLAAAERAERLHAPAAAHEHLERALALWPALSTDACASCGPLDELLRRAALAAEQAGAFSRAATLTEERIALADGDPPEQALRWERLARYRWEAADGHGSRAAYEEAVRVLPDGAQDDVRAKVISGLAWHLAATFHYDPARALADQAMLAVEGVEDPAVRWQVYLAAGIANLGTERGHAALEESCRLATAMGAGDLVVLARLWLNFSFRNLGLTDEAESNLRIGLRVAAAAGLGHGLEPALRYMFAERMLETGRWDESAEAIELNLRLRTSGIPAYFTHGYRVRLAAWRGDVDTMEESLAHARSLAEMAPQQPLPLASALTGQAESLLWVGDPVAAATVSKEAMRLGVVDPYVFGEALALRCRAEADLAAKAAVHGKTPDPAVAADLVVEVTEIDTSHRPRLEALATTCRADLSRAAGERDPVPWRDAILAWSAAGDPYQKAVSQWRLAWALLDTRSGRDEAATLLTRSRGVGEALGARPLVTAIDALARRARLRLGESSAGTSDGAQVVALTAREAEILPLLAAGRTNAEIAEVLVISPRTVGVHVSRILHKLGASRRAEVADLAGRAGLLTSAGIRRTTDVPPAVRS